MFYEALQSVEDSIHIYLIADGTTYDVLCGNQLAHEYFGTDQGIPNLDDLYLEKDNQEIQTEVLYTLSRDNPLHFTDAYFRTNHDKPMCCDVQISYVDEKHNLIFLVIKPAFEESYDESAIFLSDVVDLSINPHFVLEFNENLTVTYGNKEFYESIITTEEVFQKEYHSSFLQLLNNETKSYFCKTLEQRLEHENECGIDVELSLTEKYYQLFRMNLCKMVHQDGTSSLFGVLIAIKKQSELMKKIEYDQQYFDIMQEFSKDLLFRIDVKKKILIHRGDVSNLYGLPPVLENFPESIRNIRLVHPDDLEGYVAFAYHMMTGVSAVFEPRMQFKNGTFEKYRLQGKPLFDSEGNVVQIVGKSENIQKYVEIEARANYDSLTTTLNKQSFRELVQAMLSRAVERDKYALLFLDFDNFKKVNDTMGHVFGDFLLEVTSKRILNSVRNHDRVGRVGGDEFVIFFHHAPNREAVQERAEAILHSLRRPFNNGDMSYSIKASIGVALFPEHATNYDDLYHYADKALYRSKDLGKDVVTIYSDELGE